MSEMSAQLNNPILLGVNIDHVATLRQARLTRYPDPLEAVFAAERGGADGITVHLREDRRHIQPRDVELIQQVVTTRLNLEMAPTTAMLAYAEQIRPAHCCLVPEKRDELTTEGGLNVLAQKALIYDACARLHAANIQVSLFIDPDLAQIEAAHASGAPAVEIHTGAYADAVDSIEKEKELKRIITAVRAAKAAGLIVNAGHGLHYQNVMPIAALPEINELNIGHAIISHAVFWGLERAVREMKNCLLQTRGIFL